MERDVINSIREFNRFYTTILGAVNNHILESGYSLTEARVIYELANSHELTAREIKEKLQIDEGYTSRIINRFVKNGILNKMQLENDKRAYILKLTAKGETISKSINQQADRQVKDLIEHLGETEKEKLAALISQIKSLLTKSRTEKLTTIVIKKADTAEGFAQGKLLFEEYAGSLDFDLGYQDFKKELQTIARQYKEPGGALLLCFINNESVVGCAGIRKFSEGVAELKRLYVKPDHRGLKIGKKLLESAIDIAKQMNYKFIRLDTVPGQTKAQELYHYLRFYEIEPYRYSPIEGTIYFEKKLVED
jgi:DNA-binding MarR family transcriptional regulator/GNAT superfamily N-acetyltransferase